MSGLHARLPSCPCPSPPQQAPGLCVKGPGQEHQGTWARRTPSLRVPHAGRPLTMLAAVTQQHRTSTLSTPTNLTCKGSVAIHMHFLLLITLIPLQSAGLRPLHQGVHSQSCAPDPRLRCPFTPFPHTGPLHTRALPACRCHGA